MKKILSLIAIVFCCFSSKHLLAQTTSASAGSLLSSFSKNEEIANALSGKAGRSVTGFDNRYEGVKGSPFLYDDWKTGKLTIADSLEIEDKTLYKFDAYNNEVWIKLFTGQERVLYNNELLRLDLTLPDGKNIRLRKAKLPDSNDKNHFSVSLFEGKKVLLLKDVKKVLRKANLVDRGIVSTGNPYDWFEENINFYVKVEARSASKASLKKNSLIDALNLSSPQAQSVEKFCKSNNLTGKLTEEEAIKVLEFVDLLLQK